MVQLIQRQPRQQTDPRREHTGSDIGSSSVTLLTINDIFLDFPSPCKLPSLCNVPIINLHKMEVK